jgi:arylsulfatase A-like enzyme
MAPAGDRTVESLVSADLPPVEASGSGDEARLVQWAPVSLRYALSLPEGARLRVGVAAAAGAADGARYAVKFQLEGEPERRLLDEGVPEKGAAREHTVILPGRAGEVAWLSLEAEAGPDGRAGIEWHAPRVTGVAPVPAAPVGLDEAAALRERLEGASVVLVLLDAARARELSTYGYERSTTLEIDRIAREGVVFDQAYTPATYTISAVSALWTSLHHDQHHHGVNFRGPLPRTHTTLAEILERGGIHTTGLVANPSAGAAFGLDRGFGEFLEVGGLEGRTGPRAERLAAAFEPQLDRVAGGRFFSYIHFLEPHFPYDQPEPFVTLFGPDAPLTPEERRHTRWITAVNQRRRPFTAEEGAHLVRLYDGNLAYVDREIGRLRRRLEDRGLLDRVVLVITADHGDELFERGVIGHGATVNQEVLRIPLIIRFPGGRGPAGLRVETPVDLIDVAPTILDIFGLAGAEGSEAFEGRSLLPLLFGGEGRPALVGRSMHERPSYSYRAGPDKLIHSVRTGRTNLYRIPDDPDETADLSAAEPIRTEMLRQALYRLLRGLKRRRGDRGEALSPRTEEALRALGYLQ